MYVYIIINVIDDCNVLCFYIDYFGEKLKDDMSDKKKKLKFKLLLFEVVVGEIFKKYDFVIN